ncbi:hypothetical protein BDZ94DRAFT_1238850 [Collybia nuda]|uniref:Uncharacterized protein n=1 Tax=Collybia nuda TaxID=64659 RepID=A0A9P5Y0A4_9AGAR|nr:hypothetical protein BDZ94DRAFT_1238850 [Collybia nuda]
MVWRVDVTEVSAEIAGAPGGFKFSKRTWIVNRSKQAQGTCRWTTSKANCNHFSWSWSTVERKFESKIPQAIYDLRMVLRAWLSHDWAGVRILALDPRVLWVFVVLQFMSIWGLTRPLDITTYWVIFGKSYMHLLHLVILFSKEDCDPNYSKVSIFTHERFCTSGFGAIVKASFFRVIGLHFRVNDAPGCEFVINQNHFAPYRCPVEVPDANTLLQIGSDFPRYPRLTWVAFGSKTAQLPILRLFGLPFDYHPSVNTTEALNFGRRKTLFMKDLAVHNVNAREALGNGIYMRLYPKDLDVHKHDIKEVHDNCCACFNYPKPL